MENLIWLWGNKLIGFCLCFSVDILWSCRITFTYV